MRLPIALLGALLLLTAPASAKVFTVNSVGDAADSNTADGECLSTVGNSCTLRAAIQQANVAADSDEITVPKGDYQLTIGDLTITKNLTITAPSGSRETSLHLNGARSLISNAPGGSVTITGLAVTDHSVSGSAVPVSGGDVTLNGFDIHDNT